MNGTRGGWNSNSTRSAVALFVLAIAAGTCPAARASEPLQRLGRTVVRFQDENFQTVLGWQDASRTFRKSRWLSLDLAVAPKKGPVTLRPGDVELVLPEGTRVPLAAAERYFKSGEPQGPNFASRSGAEHRDPLEGTYFRPVDMDGRPVIASGFYTRTIGGVFPGEVEAGPWKPLRSLIHFEAPRGKWPEGPCRLVLGSIGVELAFNLPADDPKEGSGTASAR